MRTPLLKITACLFVILPGSLIAAEEAFTTTDLSRVRRAGSAIMSPDGQHIAYLRSIPRTPFEEDSGSAYSELHVVGVDGRDRAFITGKVSVRSIAWTPDGSGIAFLAKRGKDKHNAMYYIPVDGGEARRILGHKVSISSFSFSADGSQVAFLAKEKKAKDTKKLEDKGFNAEVYEERLRATRVWIGTPQWSADQDEPEKPRMLELDGSANALRWCPVDDRLAVTMAATPLVDDTYMASKIHIINATDGKTIHQLDTPGKLGSVRWSPDGTHLAIISAEDLNDPDAGRLWVANASTAKIVDVVPNYDGQVADIAWQNNESILYLGEEGVWTALASVDKDGSNRGDILAAGTHVMSGLSLAKDGQSGAMLVQSDRHPPEVFTMKHGDKAPRRLTDHNPWLANKRFAKQEAVIYKARDGMDIGGILIRPLDEKPGQRYPLIVAVHGGPEAHERNGWLTVYSRPGQIGAARGFAVFYPNYRGSTGRGVAFSKMGQSDYGGAEFDDLLDAVDHLVKIGLVDRKRVGVTGGSYGGFASAWCATKHSEHFAASVMFVGISDQISKFGTTDIPNEMYLVHSRKWPWDDWEFFRDRSPLSYVEKCRTPILIMHGKNDTRVHPSQSMELYRYLKTLGKVPVRLVFYPGEGHGNRKSAARIDYNMRLMRWMEHYLKGDGGDPPSADLDYTQIRGDEEEDEDDAEDHK
jgi:dipeptidyl aminopeptidase/acylaminoacyl peptidase